MLLSITVTGAASKEVRRVVLFKRHRRSFAARAHTCRMHDPSVRLSFWQRDGPPAEEEALNSVGQQPCSEEPLKAPA